MSLTRFVPDIPLDVYRERFKEHIALERRDGILEARIHTHDGPAAWSYELHRALGQVFGAIGQDRENELMILTATGDHWINQFDLDSLSAPEKEPHLFKKSKYELWYLDGTKLLENLLWGIDVPTIAVVNGPGVHTEFALVCDMTIAADDARFFEPHFTTGYVPGDGQFLVYQQLMGVKRASHMMYSRRDGISAQEALDWGVVGEIMPREKLMSRARELAAEVMKQDRIVRRLTTQLVRRPWRKLFSEDFTAHFGHEMFGSYVS